MNQTIIAGTYTIKSDNFTIRVEVYPNLVPNEFGVIVTKIVKNADGTAVITPKKISYYTNDRSQAFINDLNNRGGILQNRK